MTSRDHSPASVSGAADRNRPRYQLEMALEPVDLIAGFGGSSSSPLYAIAGFFDLALRAVVAEVEEGAALRGHCVPVISCVAHPHQTVFESTRTCSSNGRLGGERRR